MVDEVGVLGVVALALLVQFSSVSALFRVNRGPQSASFAALPINVIFQD
jgi:hypothetical protein